MDDLGTYYERPDFAALEAEVRMLASQCEGARSGEELVNIVTRWSELRAAIDTQHKLAQVRHFQNIEDEALETEKALWDETTPLLRELDALHARTVTRHPFAPALDQAFGSQFLARMGCLTDSFAPEIGDALVREQGLIAEHGALLAEPDARFRGERISIAALGAHFADKDRQVRREAYGAMDRFLAERGSRCDAIYDELVSLRHEMGRALGHDRFTPLAYRKLQRTDLGPSQSAAFRQAILDEIVPVVSELRETQRRFHGGDSLVLHDEPLWDHDGDPPIIDDPDRLLDGASRLFHEVAGELGAFFDMLRRRGLCDLDPRPGKAMLGFAVLFHQPRLPFIFGNRIGSVRDIALITHECGHAYQMYRCRDRVPVVEYSFPTLEACEVHSMGMELLTLPYVEHLFDRPEDGARYRRNHLRYNLTLLPELALGDHFQHDVYDKPDWSPARRRQRWRELEAMYMPHRSYGGLYPHLESGGYWQRIPHFFSEPFYLIDYALAGVCAFLLWERASRDRVGAVTDYLAMCQIGGSQSFLGMIDAVGLDSPFEPQVVRRIARAVRDELDRDPA